MFSSSVDSLVSLCGVFSVWCFVFSCLCGLGLDVGDVLVGLVVL